MGPDKQIARTLAQLHQESFGTDHRCRWRHSEEAQTYSCAHITIPARIVTERYWRLADQKYAEEKA